MKEYQKMCILIPSWNGVDILSKTLPSLFQSIQTIQDRINVDIIVIDDHSDDGTSLWIQKNYPTIQILLLSENKTGFVDGINFALSQIQNCDYLFLLNNDVKLDPNYIGSLLSKFNDPSVFAASGQIYDWTGENFLYGSRGVKFSKGNLIFYNKELNDNSPSLFACAGAGLYRFDIFKQMGGFNSIYAPFYYEEIDISYRALKLGYKIIYDPSCKAYHWVQHSMKKKYTQNEINILSGRNYYLFCWENLSDRSLKIAHWFWLPIHLGKDLFRLRFRFWKSFFLAIKQYFKKHQKLNENYILSDKDVLKMVSNEF